jgi:glycogen debranching enzyme
MEERLETLWDEDTGLYLNRREDTGAFEYRLSPFHFHALYSRKVGQARAERIVGEHLLNPGQFWGEYVLPSIARDDPAFPDNTYWRGRVWAPMNYLTYMALSEYDFPQARRALAEKSAKLILGEWLELGHVHEKLRQRHGGGLQFPPKRQILPLGRAFELHRPV